MAIADGDTLTVLDAINGQHRIRLSGIDAPESRQAFGTRARQALADLVFGREVLVRVGKRDRYGRSVGKVMAGDRDVSLEMVRLGLAWHYRAYQNEQSGEDRNAYAAAEREARVARRGLWADASPVPPWDFRHGGRQSGDAAVTSGVTATPSSSPSRGTPVIGNRNSMIYHRPDCPNYGDVSPRNRVPFATEEEAERAGYRVARNCPR